MKPLTGADLLAALQEMDAKHLELPVIIAGCDCIGFACNVEVDLTTHEKASDEYVGKYPHIYIDRASDR